MSEIIYNAYVDDWTHCDESIEEVATQKWESLEDYERPKDRVITLYKGVKRKQKFSDFLSVDWLIDEMAEWAYDNSGEFAEDYLDDVTDDQKQELESLICKWAEKHNIAPSFSMIKDIKKIQFTIPDEWE